MRSVVSGLWRRLRDLRRNRWRVADRALSVTREGAVVLGATFLIGAAAINTGNNLLYLLVAMLLGTVTVSGVLSEMVLRGLLVERRFPPSPHAGSIAAVRYRITNTKRRFPSFALVIDDTLPAERRALVVYLASGETAVVEAAVRFPTRGRVPFDTLEVVTRFPFGLFQKRKIVSLPGAITVYPSLGASDDGAPHGGGQGEDVATRSRGAGGDIYELRDYAPGDALRDIHWKTTARRGVLTAQEHEDEDRPRLTLILDTGTYMQSADAPDGPAAYALERAISHVAGTAKHWDARGYVVRVQTACGEVSFGHGAAHLHRIWEHLAAFALPARPAPVTPLRPGDARLVIRPAHMTQDGARLPAAHVA